jgi:putative membrane protein
MNKQLKLIPRSAILALAAGAIGFTVNALAQTPGTTSAQKKEVSAANPSSRGTEATTGALDAKDRAFLNAAAKGGMMEVHMGEMAQKMGQSADVKKIGAQMVADHTKANNELMTLAQAKGVKPDTRHKMDKMDSANFDQTYLEQMVKDHNQDIAEFQTEAKTGMDADVKAFAKKQLPTLQKHLKLVQAAQKKVGGSTGGNGNAGAKKKS